MLYGFVGLMLILMALLCVVAVMVIVLREKPHDDHTTDWVRSPFAGEAAHAETAHAPAGDPVMPDAEAPTQG